MKNRSTIFITILAVLACFAFAPVARAQTLSPPPDGDYPNGTTAEGFQALFNVDTNVGIFNTALGWVSLWNNVDASFSTGVGAGTLFNNNAADNTAVGAAALFFNVSGADNTAVGVNALRDTIDSGNTAVGSFALFANIAGLSTGEGPNTAVGLNALVANTTGSGNVGVGADELAGEGVLGANTTGSANTAIGQHVLRTNIDGIWNTAVGAASLLDNDHGSFNTAIGVQAGLVLTGSNNVCVGQAAGISITTGSDIIAVGQGVTGVSGFFGEVDDACYIKNIWLHGVDPGSGFAVFVDADGKLGTHLGIPPSSPSKRLQNVQPMGGASDSIVGLKPVTFRYKKEFDPEGTPQFGFVAEEVAKVNPDLVVRDRDGKPVMVRYEQLNAMLLNEFLKEHKKVEEQQARISQLKSEMQTMVAQLKEQAAQIQKVSAQLQMNKPAAKVVVNKP